MLKFILLLILSMNSMGQVRKPVKANRYEFLTGVRKKKDDKSFWDKKYKSSKYIFGKAPAKFLSSNYEYIPRGSSVLDMGMGEGRNAVFLAHQGYKVTGVDISSVAVKKARMLAKEFNVRINTVVASMNKYKIPDGSFDSIICFYYVDRSLHEQMWKWLKPGGILIYEAHTDLQRKVQGNENYDRRYLLREGELLNMFKDYKVLMYEEPLHQKEFRASIILQKPLE